MTDIVIQESGLNFGPYSSDRCFHIEKSETYKRLKASVKITEFLLIRGLEEGSPVVCVVEAKSSSPQPINHAKFVQYVNEIRDKFVNGFSLGLAACLRRHPAADAELPDSFKTLDLSTTMFRFILVINGHKKEWLPPLQDAIRKSLLATIRTWALSATPVAVLNEDKALKYGLILSVNTAD